MSELAQPVDIGLLAQPVDIGLVRLVKLEEQIASSETTGVRARWEFGHELLSHRVGKRLPNRYLVKVCDETGASRPEVTNRMRFAERFPSEAELSNALDSFGSWHAIVEALPDFGGARLVELPPPLPEGVFRTICADPPWQYGNTSTRGAAEDHYETLTIAQLCGDAPIPGFADDLAAAVRAKSADEAHLYLWTTNGFLREAFDVLVAWGFEYKTTLVWVKPQIGMGNYFRSSSEYILFGVRGGMRTLDCNQRNWFEAKRGRHSKKPGYFFDLVEKVSPGPFLEMFAREWRLSEHEWSYWGNEG